MKSTTTTFKSLSNFKKIILVGFLIGLLGFILLVTLRLMVKVDSIGDIPSLVEIKQIQNPLSSEIYSKEGKFIGSFYKENRSYLEEEEMNTYFKDALIATEDVRFYSHNGVDKRSIMRVIFKTLLLSKQSSGGGSTITQQLAKNLYPRKRFKLFSTVLNKFREIEIAKKIERLYSKDEILLMYANTVSFGERAFGLKIAAQRFYNKAPIDLSLDEASTLVGMLKATSYYSPRRYPDRAISRRNVVLGQMVKYGYITEEQQKSASVLPIKLEYNSPNSDFQFAAYFKQELRKQFAALQNENKKLEDYNLDLDGLVITTTLDYDIQIAAEAIMVDHMTRLQQTFTDSWKGADMLEGNASILNDKLTGLQEYRAAKANGKSSAEAKKQLAKPSKKTVWTWNGFQSQNISTVDSIMHYLGLLHTGILATDTKTGGIRAWVGGIDYGKFQYDNIKGARQVGSTFKPIVYLTALSKGVQPCDEFNNELRTYTDFQDWTPKNSDDNYGDIVTMKGALTHSINTVSVQVLFRAGINSVVEMAEKLGITSKLNPVPSLVLGTSDISLKEMVNAYSTIGNQGKKNEQYCISKIVDKEGRTIYEHQLIEPEIVVDSIYTQALSGMLQNATLNGTGARLYSEYGLTIPLMGKTGTTQNQSDGWFVGFNDDLTIGAWVGTEDRRIHFRYLGHGAGSRSAMPMVASLFKVAEQKGKIEDQGLDYTYVDACFDRLSPEQLIERRREERLQKQETLTEAIADLFSNKRRHQQQQPRYPTGQSRQQTSNEQSHRTTTTRTQTQSKRNVEIFINKWEERIQNFEKNMKDKKRRKRKN